MLDAAAAPDTDVPSTAVESPTLPVAPPVADAAVTPGPPGGLPPGDTELSEALAVEPTPAPAAAPQPKARHGRAEQRVWWRTGRSALNAVLMASLANPSAPLPAV